MKKLLMAAAVVVSAITLNAATVTWSLTNITDSEKNTAKAGMAAYFLLSSTYSTFSDNVAALADGSMKGDAFISYVTGNSTYSTATKAVTGRTGATSINVSQASGNYAAGDTVNGYIVLFDTANAADASYFAYTPTQSATVGAAGAPITLAYGNFASGTSGWTAVPEPTSGLLLLLGMAGLAIRRKCA